MARISPTLEGFRAAFRRPSFTFAEIAWRWIVGAVAWTLLFFSFFEYVNTLPVTHGDKALLGTRQPLLIGRAISHIFRGSLNRAVFAALVGALALAVLWTIAASTGRIATVRALLEYFRRDASDEPAETKLSIIRPLLIINFLRIAATLATILGFLGAAILVSFVSTEKNPRPGTAFLLFLPFAALICAVWPALNWYLSLTSVFAIRDEVDAPVALSSAVAFSRERAGPLFAIGAWIGLAHLTALSVAGTAASLPMAFAQVVPGRLVLGLITLIAMAYFALVDWLYIARLAAYLCILEMPEVSESTPSESAPSPLPQTEIDRDEPILSDLPNLAVET